MRDGLTRPTSNNEPPTADPLVGRVIAGKYSVAARLGAGAMGIVYRATQIALERTVAIKVLHRELATDSEFAERFWREARAASRLDHPNSIRVLDFGQETDGLLYLAMEYVEGCDLFDWLVQHAPVAPQNIVALLSQVLAALAVAHDMAVVHRDLKPENVMIVRGTSDDGRAVDVVKVCDFGIAKILNSSTSASEARRRHSTTGLVVGTPAYMSPEQARGEKQDARSDLYSVGVMLYELLAGRVPFEAETLIGVAMKHVNESPERPSARAAGVDPELEAICLKAISKKPADRFQTAREMRQALLAAASKTAFGSEPLALAASLRPPAPLRREPSKPTLTGVAPGTPAPRTERSRAWLALLLVPGLAGVSLVRYRSALFGAREHVEPVQSAVGAAPVSSLSTALPQPEPIASHALPEVPAGSSARPPVSGKRHHANVDAGALTIPVQAATIAPAEAAAPAPQAPAIEPPPVPSADSRAVAPSAPAPPPTAPAAPTYEPALAHVTIGAARNAVGATTASVTRAVSEAAARILSCYKSALPQLGSVFEGADVLHVDTDGAGVISDARLTGPVRGSVAVCVAAAVQGHRVANVDTGNASADVPISFKDH